MPLGNLATFPERSKILCLVRIYQNELSLESGLQGEHDAWLRTSRQSTRVVCAVWRAFRGDAPRIFPQAAGRNPQRNQRQAGRSLFGNGRAPRSRQPGDFRTGKAFARFQSERAEFFPGAIRLASGSAKRLHDRAFTSTWRIRFRKLTEIAYGTATSTAYADPQRRRVAPVSQGRWRGKLPTISCWCHPNDSPITPVPRGTAPGTSRRFWISCQEPAVWKKTSSSSLRRERRILRPRAPFVAPDPPPETGRVSKGSTRGWSTSPSSRTRYGTRVTRGSSIGLGTRADGDRLAWSRGGASAHRYSTTLPCCSS